MKIYKVVVMAALAAVISCTPSGEQEEPVRPDPKVDDGPEAVDPTVPKEPVSGSLTLAPIDSLNAGGHTPDSHTGLTGRSTLTAIYDSYVQLSASDCHVSGDSFALYPRMTRANNGTYILFYHQKNGSSTSGNQCYYMTSPDMKNWTFRQELFKEYKFVDPEYGPSDPVYKAFAGADVTTLQDGTILVAASYRHKRNFRYKREFNGVCIRLSHDNGETFGPETPIYQGTNWEPYPIQLPSGRVEVYFTDSHVPTPGIWTLEKDGDDIVNGDNSSYVWSDDGGTTWYPEFGSPAIKAAQQVRAYDAATDTYLYTDQMPSVICLNDGVSKVCANESAVGIPRTFHISLSYSDPQGNWSGTNSRGDIPAERINNMFKGCAPYLLQFPSGEVILTYNTTQNGSNVLFMRMSSPDARSFGEARRVFPFDGSGYGYWGSTYRIDPHQMAVCLAGSGKILQMCRFYLNHAITPSRRTVKVDGDNGDWNNEDEALFVGTKSPVQATLRCCQDKDNLYFLAEVRDTDISKSDYVSLQFASPGGSCLASGDVKVTGRYNGLLKSYGFSSYWSAKEMGVSGVGAFDGTLDSSSDRDNGYLVEFSIPRRALPILDGKVLVNFSIRDKSAGVEDFVIEPAGSSNAVPTLKWIPITGL